MAREIVVEYQGKTSSFGFQKVDRAKLYGKKRRIAIGPDGEPCSRAALSADGAFIVRSGMAAQGYFDEDDCWIPNAELQGLDEDDRPVEKQPSTLGVAQKLAAANVTELLDLQVSAVYALDEKETDGQLLQALSEGQFFRFPFNFRDDFQMEHAFLVGNDAGVFALVGQPARVDWCELDAPAVSVIDDLDEDESDDLDFEMF